MCCNRHCTHVPSQRTTELKANAKEAVEKANALPGTTIPEGIYKVRIFEYPTREPYEDVHSAGIVSHPIFFFAVRPIPVNPLTNCNMALTCTTLANLHNTRSLARSLVDAAQVLRQEGEVRLRLPEDERKAGISQYRSYT